MNLAVDRLTLRLSGRSSDDGQRLARLIGEGLAAAAPLAAVGQVPSLRLAVDVQAGEPLQQLANRIVAAWLEALARALP